MSEMSDRSPGLLLVVSGPSGAGKTTIVHAIEQRLNAVFSVSVTTRRKGATEVEGRDYYFVDTDRFNELIQRNELLEYAKVFGRDWYGTPRRPVEQQLAEGKLVILEIDVQGALQVKEARPDAFMIFVLPPNFDSLQERLRHRGREDEASIQNRLAGAKQEIDFARSSKQYDMEIVNDDLDKTITEVCSAINKRRAVPQSTS